LPTLYRRGPWDSTLYDQGATAKLFVANGLNGTISRLNLSVGTSGVTVTSTATIASGYMLQCDPAAFVDAPTGLVYESATTWGRSVLRPRFVS